LDLTGHVVIVTGSSSGIGEAVARRLAGAGARIVVNSASSVDAGERLAGELGEAAQDRWGRLDGLVNNAAVTADVPLADIDGVTVDHWNRVLGVNVVGTFLVSQAALPLLRAAEDGWIINITSIAGIRQTGSSLPYAVSKAAVDHLTTILAKHAGGGVRVNAVAPGLVATPWTETWDAIKEGVTAMAPLKRVATPDDIADACVGLIGTRYATGQTLLVDGGLGLVL
jgi:ketoreductase RED2